MNLTGNDLKNIGFAEGKALGLALELVEQHYAGLSKEDQIVKLKEVLENPAAFVNDLKFSPLAVELLKPKDNTVQLNTEGKSYRIYGAEAIEQGALNQMEIAMKLPVTVAGALMPDAHQGYGLPIGGVLATKNAVIPYGVGVDIGCRMCMTLYDLPITMLEEKKEDLKKMLVNNTKFGQATFKKPKEHEIFERKEFSELSIVREMKDRAWQQIGSSGGGNHFVEFGIVEILNPINEFNLLLVNM
jgi:tRNA-splicing ligase RtcB